MYCQRTQKEGKKKCGTVAPTAVKERARSGRLLGDEASRVCPCVYVCVCVHIELAVHAFGGVAD